MAAIDIKRTHSLEIDNARKKIQKVADHISEKFDVDCAWQGNTLHFSRSGIDGHIKVNPKSIHVFADLGFLFLALKNPIESEIGRYLDKEFSTAGA